MTRIREVIACSTAAALLASTAGGALAASHREAPGITLSPKIDGTDFYMFRSYEAGRADYVTFIANYIPLQAPYGGPNYFTMDEDAIYEIHVDNDGDAIEDITFQFDFENILKGQTIEVDGVDVAIPLRQRGPIGPGSGGEDNANEIERYALKIIRGDRRAGDIADITRPGGGTFVKALDYFGEKTFPNYEAYADNRIYEIAIPDCDAGGKVFVGQREEAFAVNLGRIFDLVNTSDFAPIEQTGSTYSGSTPDQQSDDGLPQSRDAFEDVLGISNVTSLAIEVPISCLTGDGNGVIGAWTTSSVPQAKIEDPSPTYEQNAVYGGAYVQRSRLSAPLVNEVVIGLPDKDLFNAAEPFQDGALATYVTNPVLPELLELLFGAPAPNNFPRGDLVAAFLTGFEGVNQLATVTPSEMMRLNTAIDPTVAEAQSNFGVLGGDLAGFPNGRRPGDDVVDIALRVVMGVLCHADLGVCDPEDAPAGTVAFTDGAPLDASDVGDAFPYLNTPIPGAP